MTILFSYDAADIIGACAALQNPRPLTYKRISWYSFLLLYQSLYTIRNSLTSNRQIKCTLDDSIDMIEVLLLLQMKVLFALLVTNYSVFSAIEKTPRMPKPNLLMDDEKSRLSYIRDKESCPNSSKYQTNAAFSCAGSPNCIYVYLTPLAVKQKSPNRWDREI